VDHRAGSVFVRARILLILLLTAATPVLAASRHDLSFSYSVAQEPGSGSLVHASVHLLLTNYGQDPISIQKLTVHHVHPVGHVKPWSTVTVQPHSSQQITQELTLTRPEFERWQKDIGTKLSLEVQSPGNKFIEAVRPDKVQVEK
jgi:hypothetical protein